MKLLKRVELKDILSLDQEFLFQYFFKEKVSTNYRIYFKNTLRNDTKASCWSAEHPLIKDLIVLFDFGHREYNMKNIVELYCKMNNTTPSRAFKKLTEICKVNNRIFNKNKEVQIIKSPEQTLVPYQRPYKRVDFLFWEQFGWTELMVRNSGIIRIYAYKSFDRHSGVYKFKHCHAPTYWLPCANNLNLGKVYCPSRPSVKWRGSMKDADYFFVGDSSTDKLCITSSKKDCGTLHSVFGWDCYAFNSESIIPSKCIPNIDKIIKKSSTIIIWLDADEVGRKYARIIKKYILSNYNKPVIVIDTGEVEYKDPSDFYKKYGRSKLEALWKN